MLGAARVAHLKHMETGILTDGLLGASLDLAQIDAFCRMCTARGFVDMRTMTQGTCAAFSACVALLPGAARIVQAEPPTLAAPRRSSGAPTPT